MSSLLGDWGSSLFIIVMMLLFYSLILSLREINNVKNNWDKYKCNPTIMPFASLFGHNIDKILMNVLNQHKIIIWILSTTYI